MSTEYINDVFGIDDILTELKPAPSEMERLRLVVLDALDKSDVNNKPIEEYLTTDLPKEIKAIEDGVSKIEAYKDTLGETEDIDELMVVINNLVEIGTKTTTITEKLTNLSNNTTGNERHDENVLLARST